MDHMMHLTYVSFSYLSKVYLGGKAVHWTRTLSQDSCSRNEPMHYAHLFPLLLFAYIYNRSVQSDEENAKIQGNLCPIFFLVLDFLVFVLFFLPGVADPPRS